MTIALSFRVREPARARTMAALLNARFLGLGDMMLTGRATLDQTWAILAAMIRDEIKLRDDSAYRALAGPRRLDLDPGEDNRESLIRDERAIAGAYSLVAKYGKGLKVDAALEVELGAAGFDEDRIYIIVDWLKMELPKLVSADAGEFGLTMDELKGEKSTRCSRYRRPSRQKRGAALDADGAGVVKAGRRGPSAPSTPSASL